LNCIDAIEGTVKEIIIRIFNQYITLGQDDTEYIMNVKAVVEGSEEFALKNSDVISSPHTLKAVLYDFAKMLWLQNLQKNPPQASEETLAEKESVSDEDGYHEYYYDHIYHHGGYPR
jgi:hypothetical protein